jgi:hypothetical protein
MPQEQACQLFFEAGDGEAGSKGAISLLQSVEVPAEVAIGQPPHMEGAHTAARDTLSSSP